MISTNPGSPTGWPWPLDAVQNWFEGLWTSIESWVQDASKTVWTWMPPPLQKFVGFLEDLAQSTWNALLEFFKDPVAALSKAFTALGTQLWDTLKIIGEAIGDSIDVIIQGVSTSLSDAWTGITSMGSWIWSQITEGLNWFKGVVWGWVEGALQWATDTFKWLRNEMSEDAAWIVSEMGTMFDGGLGGIFNVFTDWPRLLTDAIAKVFEPLFLSLGAVPMGASPVVMYYRTVPGGWPTMDIGWFEGVIGKGLEAGGRWLLESIEWIAQQIVGLMMVVKDAVTPILTPILTNVMTAATESIMPGSPNKELESAAHVFSVRILNRLKDFPPKHKSPLPTLAELLSASAGVVGLNILTVLGLDGIATYLDMAHPMKMTGIMNLSADLIESLNLPAMIGPILFSNIYTGIIMPLRYRWNEIYTPLIPPIPDLIRFVVREVITPDTFVTYAKYHGYSEEHSGWFWMAHWILPAFGNAVDAYHRGIITSEELNKFLVWHDYSPKPRPGIGKTDVEIMRGVVKTLIPRVDIRYAWEMGLITDEELGKWYEYLGYEEDAPLMARIQMARALVEEIHKVRDEWIKAFTDGFIKEGTLRANLSEIGIGPARINYYVVYAVMRREREHKKTLLDVYEDSYQKDLDTSPPFEAAVKGILVDPKAADLFIREAYVKKYKKPRAA